MPRNHFHSIESKLHLTTFYANKNVEAYLEWKTKVDQIF